jgi:hypothetical protein
MKCFIDGKPIDLARLTYREMGGGGIPIHLCHALRIDLTFDEVVTLLADEYASLVAELRSDIAKMGDASQAEQAALDNPTLRELVHHAPEQLVELLDVYLWRDLAALLFGENLESEWEYVADGKLDAVKVDGAYRLFVTAYPLGPFEAELR